MAKRTRKQSDKLTRRRSRKAVEQAHHSKRKGERDAARYVVSGDGIEVKIPSKGARARKRARTNGSDQRVGGR